MIHNGLYQSQKILSELDGNGKRLFVRASGGREMGEIRMPGIVSARKFFLTIRSAE